MKRFYLDSGGIPCDLETFDKDNPLSSVVNAEQAVALLNQFQAELEAAVEAIKHLLPYEGLYFARNPESGMLSPYDKAKALDLIKYFCEQAKKEGME